MQRESRPVTVKCFSEMLIEIETAVWRICETRGQPTNTGQWVGHHHHLPHVDEILGQSHGLAVPCDGDGPVQVGGGVSVLAVGDADHGSGELSAQIIIISNTVLEFSLHLISATLDPPLPMMQPMSSLGTVISWVCCWAAWLLAWPVNKARAREEY